MTVDRPWEGDAVSLVDEFRAGRRSPVEELQATFAAIDACDVCYKAGKGYYQEGDNMVCRNCGRRFASNRINDVKGGCNPAPLNREVQGANLVITMKDINANKWYMKYRKK